MPNYEFKCLECGHCFEALLPAGTESTKCLECGHPEAQKQLAAPQVKFIGTGFYKTDSTKNDVTTERHDDITKKEDKDITKKKSDKESAD